MEILHPGVYIQEVPSGARPIEGAGTSTAAFIGKAQKGPLNKATLVTSAQEFEASYGGFLADSFLAHSVQQFFNNGGKKTYVVRVAGSGAVAADITIKDRTSSLPVSTLTIKAANEGVWGNKLDVAITDGSADPDNEFAISVFMDRSDLVPPLLPLLLETHDNLHMNPSASNFVEKVVAANSKYISVAATSDITHAAPGTSRSGSIASTISLTAPAKFVIELNGDGPHIVSLTGSLTGGTAIATAIQSEVTTKLSAKRATNAGAFTGFTCSFVDDPAPPVTTPPTQQTGMLVLTSGISGLNSSVHVTNAPSDIAAGLLKLGLTNGGHEVDGSAVLRPAKSKTPGFPGDTEYHLGDAVAPAGNIDAVKPGDDGATPGPLEHKNGFQALDTIRDVNIVAVPGIGALDVVAFGTNYCAQRGDCFFVGDVNSTDDTVAEAQTFINSLTVKASYGAVYFPWLRMADPTGNSVAPIAAPPSGFVAGMYARIDARRGVWKAPAGTEANIGGAVGLVADITDVQQDFLNPIGVNVLRQFPASGLVIWGARTLATRSDPEYRYVPVRRTAIFLEQSIYNGIQWAVFEPNDEDLWASLRLNVGAFMMLQFRAGAFQGKSAKDAFFVKCDNQTTTQGDIDAGIVNILVGFAPLKPAEFVVLRLTQIVGQQA